jgi:hypothetical protein
MSMDDFKKAQEPSPISAAEALQNANALEARMIPGAPTRTPKQAMLDRAEPVQAKHPDLRLRWVNVRDPQKADSRMQEGYRRLTSEEGGMHIGDELVLMGAPRQLVEAREAQQRQLNDERLVAHRHEMERAVEGVSKALRDNHGIRVNPKQLLINEE